MPDPTPAEILDLGAAIGRAAAATLLAETRGDARSQGAELDATEGLSEAVEAIALSLGAARADAIAYAMRDYMRLWLTESADFSEDMEASGL